MYRVAEAGDQLEDVAVVQLTRAVRLVAPRHLPIKIRLTAGGSASGRTGTFWPDLEIFLSNADQTLVFINLNPKPFPSPSLAPCYF